MFMTPMTPKGLGRRQISRVGWSGKGNERKLLRDVGVFIVLLEWRSCARLIVYSLSGELKVLHREPGLHRKPKLAVVSPSSRV